MAFDVSTLTDYVNEQSQELLKKLHFAGRTEQFITPMAGVKKTDALQLFALTAYPQEASGCDMVASGSAAFTQRLMNVEKIGYRDEFCMDSLLAKWTQMLLRPGAAGEDEITTKLAGEINDELQALIEEHKEIAYWQGNEASGDAIIDMFDGFIKIIDAAGTATAGNSGSLATLTTSNVIAAVNGMAAARPERLKHAPEQYMYVGTDVFDMYVQALETANLYHVDQTAWVDYKMGVIGKNITMVGLPGLTGTNRMFVGQKKNFIYGFDLLSDEDSIVWKILESDKMRYTVKFKRGVQVAYPNEIVQFRLV